MDGLQDIRVLRDIGFFGWNMNYSVKRGKKISYPDPEYAQWDDFLARLDINGQPDAITDIKELNKKLSDEEPLKLSDKLERGRRNQPIIFWESPYCVPPTIACYVASHIRGCNLDEVDFLIHGSVLGVLSRCKTTTNQESIMVQRLGGRNVINIRIVIERNGSLSDSGHQFERLVSGNDPFGRHNLIQHQYLRLLQIGPYKILTYAESDALDPNNNKPVEIKIKNPLIENSHGRDMIKLLLQMISNGSGLLITASRTKEKQSCIINSVEQYSIDTLAQSLTDDPRPRIETIQTNLGCIKDTIKEGNEECYELLLKSRQTAELVRYKKDQMPRRTQHDFQTLNSKLYKEFCKGVQSPSKEGKWPFYVIVT